jgi:DNA topoisomerase-3
MEQIKKMSEKIIHDAVSASSSWNFDGLNTTSIQRKQSKTFSNTPVGTCKLCNGSVVDKGTFYGCSNYQSTKCSFTLSKQILGKKITQAQIKKLLENGKTDVIKGFKKGEKQFDAALELTGESHKISFVFNEPALVETT